MIVADVIIDPEKNPEVYMAETIEQQSALRHYMRTHQVQSARVYVERAGTRRMYTGYDIRADEYYP